MEGFDRIFALLREHPRAGEVRSDYGIEVRVFTHRPHRVLYRCDGEDVLILRILHSAMDVPNALRGER